MTTVVGPDLLRDLTPRAVAALVRRYGHLEDCEDAVQEALAAATTQWPADGVPDNPRGWLITVASRRLIEQWRRDSARERREQRIGRFPAPAETAEVTPDLDDSLPLLLMCCHPGLARPAQVSLTLRAVGGLTTAEIARGLLLPEATVAQRISRAKRRLEEVGARFETPTTSDEWAARLPPALEVLYLIFNEGSTASAGDQVSRPDLSGEAIRLTRQLHGQVDHGEVAGLLALMLLTDARRPARTDSAGESVALAEQDRRIWRTDAIAEGTKILRGALARHRIGPLQLQAAIAALHSEAASTAATDWPQILAPHGLAESGRGGGRGTRTSVGPGRARRSCRPSWPRGPLSGRCRTRPPGRAGRGPGGGPRPLPAGRPALTEPARATPPAPPGAAAPRVAERVSVLAR